MSALEGLDVWIIDALRDQPHPSHLNVAEALDWIESLKPRRAILTNLHTDLDYDAYRDIRFRPSHSIWRADARPFELQLFHAGSYHRNPVRLMEIVDGVETIVRRGGASEAD